MGGHARPFEAGGAVVRRDPETEDDEFGMSNDKITREDSK